MILSKNFPKIAAPKFYKNALSFSHFSLVRYLNSEKATTKKCITYLNGIQISRISNFCEKLVPTKIIRQLPIHKFAKENSVKNFVFLILEN